MCLPWATRVQITADPLRAAELSLSDRKEKIAAAQRRKRRQARTTKQAPAAAPGAATSTADATASEAGLLLPAPGEGDSATLDNGSDKDNLNGYDEDNGYDETPQVLAGMAGPGPEPAQPGRQAGDVTTPVSGTAAVTANSNAPGGGTGGDAGGGAGSSRTEDAGTRRAPSSGSHSDSGSDAASGPSDHHDAAEEQRAMRLEAQTLTLADVARLDGMPLPTLLTIHQLSEAWRARKAKRASVELEGHGATVTTNADSESGGTGAIATQAGAATHTDSTLPKPFAPAPVVYSESTAPGSAQATSITTVAAGAQAEPVRLSSAGSAAGAASDLAPLTNRHPTAATTPASLQTQLEADGVQLLLPEDKHRYGFHNQPSVAQQVHLLFWRQAKLTTRNRGYVLARWINALIIGLIVSTVAFGGSSSSVQLRVSTSEHRKHTSGCRS